MRSCADIPGNFYAIFLEKQDDSQFDMTANDTTHVMGEEALLLGQILQLDRQGNVDRDSSGGDGDGSGRRDFDDARSYDKLNESFDSSTMTASERTGITIDADEIDYDDGIGVGIGFDGANRLLIQEEERRRDAACIVVDINEKEEI
jgi:hypothetical protein